MNIADQIPSVNYHVWKSCNMTCSISRHSALVMVPTSVCPSPMSLVGIPIAPTYLTPRLREPSPPFLQHP